MYSMSNIIGIMQDARDINTNTKNRLVSALEGHSAEEDIGLQVNLQKGMEKSQI